MKSKGNPYPKGSRSYEIWAKNNDPTHKDFWFNVFEHTGSHIMQEKAEEALHRNV